MTEVEKESFNVSSAHPVNSFKIGVFIVKIGFLGQSRG